MFIFSWFGNDFGGANAWQSFGLIDIILFITVLVAVGLAVMSANGQSVDLPVAASAITAGLGILSVLLILFRIISPPDFGIGGTADALGVDLEIGRKIGVFLGLIAAGGIAYGGWQAMQEEGTSFSGERDRVQDGRGGDGPPPPSSGGGTPPSSGGGTPPPPPPGPPR